MSNKQSGNQFEQEFAEMLSQHGFWVHVMQQNKAGQPADIIAVKGWVCLLIDCKVISNNDGFPFKRVEENQRFAMRKFESVSRQRGWFALKLPDGQVRMVSYRQILQYEKDGRKSIPDGEMEKLTTGFDKWMQSTEIGIRCIDALAGMG